MSIGYSFDNLGLPIPVDSCQKAYTFNGPSGAVDTITYTFHDTVSGLTSTWLQTYTYDGSNVSNDSGYVRTS